MAKSPPARDELLKALDETLRKVSAQSVLLNDTVAKLVGANPTDLECLDLLGLGGPTTAGKLAAHTGLTTGATTAVIDRLERERDVWGGRQLQHADGTGPPNGAAEDSGGVDGFESECASGEPGEFPGAGVGICECECVPDQVHQRAAIWERGMFDECVWDRW